MRVPLDFMTGRELGMHGPRRRGKPNWSKPTRGGKGAHFVEPRLPRFCLQYVGPHTSIMASPLEPIISTQA